MLFDENRVELVIESEKYFLLVKRQFGYVDWMVADCRLHRHCCWILQW